MDSMSLMSDCSWMDLQFQLSEKLLKPVSKLNVAYKFTTDPQKKAPNRLASPLHLIEMMAAAKEALARAAQAKEKGKAPAKVFKVEIVDLDAGKEKSMSKAMSSSKQNVDDALLFTLVLIC